jgi:hypothetical protein
MISMKHLENVASDATITAENFAPVATMTAASHGLGTMAAAPRGRATMTAAARGRAVTTTSPRTRGKASAR